MRAMGIFRQGYGNYDGAVWCPIDWMVMRCRLVWVTSLIVAVVACSLAYWYFIPRWLPPSHLKVGNLPRIPMQPSAALIHCSGGLDFTLDNANGDWSVVQDHPPCAVSGFALPAVQATAIEMAKVYRRPLACLIHQN